MVTPTRNMTRLSAQPARDWGFHSGDEVVPGMLCDRLLGGGRRYQAYLAMDQARRCFVVVKVLRPSLVDDDVARRAVAREAESLRRAAHPVVVRLFEAAVDHPRPHLVLEHVEGPRLSTLLRRHGALPFEQTLPLGQQLAAALRYLRHVGLVHLDLKPRNIIMAGPPRLIDFSLARDADRAAALTTPVGTRTYMSPEQADPGHAAVGPAADMWGLGVVLYQAVTGSPAFRRDGAEDYPQLSQDPPPLPRGVPPRLVELIGACLQHHPANRPTPDHVASVLADLATTLPDRMVLSRLRPGVRRLT